VKGALLWTGDSHAAQGDGEVNLTALETAYKEMNVTVEVIKNIKLEWPRIETPDAWITLGIDRDLNVALDLLKAQTTAPDGATQSRQRTGGKADADQLGLPNYPGGRY
jgi:acetamidase/formamidase